LGSRNGVKLTGLARQGVARQWFGAATVDGIDRLGTAVACLPACSHAAKGTLMQVGAFIPIGNNGWPISTTSPKFMPSFDLNRAVVERSERSGMEFALSMIKLRGFGDTYGRLPLPTDAGWTDADHLCRAKRQRDGIRVEICGL